MGEAIADEVGAKLLALPQAGQTAVNIVSDPPWDRSMMSGAALLTLGLQTSDPSPSPRTPVHHEPEHPGAGR